MTVGWEAWALGLEASAVIGLRTLKLAQGGRAAEQEAQRMVTEKIEAAIEVGQATLRGASRGADAPLLARRALRRYGRKVSANRRRLGGS
jgi:hypothetical protein